MDEGPWSGLTRGVMEVRVGVRVDGGWFALGCSIKAHGQTGFLLLHWVCETQCKVGELARPRQNMLYRFSLV